MGAMWLGLKLFPAFQPPELYKGFLNFMGGNNKRSFFNFEPSNFGLKLVHKKHRPNETWL